MASTALFDFYIFEDENNSLNIDEATQQNFESSKTSNFAFGLSDSTYWIKVVNKNESQSWMLESCYTQLDQLDLFYFDKENWQLIETGDTRPFKNRDINHPCFVFDLSKMKNLVFYLRIRSKGSVALPLNIIESSEYWSKNTNNQFAYGLLFAVIVSMVAYNLFVSFIVNDAAYFFYVIYLSSSGLLMAARTGHSHMYLWPSFPLFADFSIIIFGLITMSSGLQFVRCMGQIDNYSIKLSKVMNFCSILLLACSLLTFVNYKTAMVFLLLFLPIGFLLIFISIRMSLKKGWTPSLFLLIGFCLLLPGSFLEFAQSVNWIKSNWFTQNALLIGIALESICLSFALASRIRMLNAQIDINRMDAIKAKQDFSRKLIESIDNERRSIARDLHDGLAQNLLALKSQLKNSINQSKNMNISVLITDSLTEIRNITRGMHPQQLETLGLATAIKSNARALLSTSRLKFTLDISDIETTLKSEAELHIFRIYQESINNTIKHSQATRISIKLNQKSGVLLLEICDNGIGFTQNDLEGIGIKSMHERAALINSQLTITKLGSGGTKILLKVPL